VRAWVSDEVIGSTIGHYRLTAKLGEGGMGAVYRATDPKLGREVAIKIVPEAFAADPDRMARFTREAHVLASLNHPNIAAIYGVEERALVMELVEGDNLRGPLPLGTALDYAGQIADALECAHEKGIVHRDLKPANIKITPQGVVKVLDFGLAKIADPPAAVASASPMSSATLSNYSSQVGMIVGTAAYMAPEQARGQAVDKRADIWAFGIVLWEMLSGRQMFAGATVSDVLASVLTKEPDLQAVPGEIRRVLGRCLEKDPRKRLRDISVWRDLLADASTAPSPEPSKLPWLAAGALALIGVFAFWAPWRSVKALENRSLIHLEFDAGGAVSQPAISRDGMRIVFVRNGQLAMRRLDRTDITPIAGTLGATFPFISPDGNSLGFFAEGKLKKIDVGGGVPITLCDAPFGRGGSWGEDGRILAALHALGGLYRIAAAGGRPEVVSEETGRVGGYPALLPAGQGFVYTSFTIAGAQPSIKVGPLGRREVATLVENSQAARYLDHGLVYVQRGTLLLADFDHDTRRLIGRAEPLVQGVAYDITTGADFDVSHSGTLVYHKGASESIRTIGWLDSAGELKAVATGAYMGPRFSPDGKKIAVALLSEERRSIVVHDLGTGSERRLTFGAEDEAWPVWSPDGEYIAYEAGLTNIAIRRSDGSGTEERFALPGVLTPLSFSPDGKWFIFTQFSSPEAGTQVLVAAVERTTGGLRLRNHRPLLEPTSRQQAMISPDGRWLAYFSDESGRSQVYVIPFAPEGPRRGGKWQISTEGGSLPRWARDGRRLFYLSSNGRPMFANVTLRADSFAAEKPVVWSSNESAPRVPLFGQFDISPDGRLVGVFTPLDGKPDTTLHVILNIGDELRRRSGAAN
jgi:predicted Ser/Thr protein kinase